jgi:hypothetical protein
MSNLDRIHVKLYTLNRSFSDNHRISKETLSTAVPLSGKNGN